MDNIAFLQNKTYPCIANNLTEGSESKPYEEDVEDWTTEYLVDRLFFEMLEIKDDAQGWEDYQNKGQRKNTMIEHMTSL